MPNPNLERFIAAAALLRPILGELVFVGRSLRRSGKVTHPCSPEMTQAF